MTLYLFWDIDGTLLLTARAGVFASEEASEEVLGRRVDLSTMQTAGMTDFEVRRIVCVLGPSGPRLGPRPLAKASFTAEIAPIVACC